MTGGLPSSESAAPPGPTRNRIAAVDIARGLAIIGMFVAHTVAGSDAPETIANGRSSILFATLAGVSIGLMTGGASPSGQERSELRTMIAIRAVCLILLGFLLNLPPTNVAIILDYYGVMFLLLVPLLFLPRWALAAIAGVIAVALPVVNAAVATGTQDGDDLPLVLGVPADWLFTGYYPAVLWLAFLLAGLICARSGLTRARTQAWMVAAGATGMLLGYGSAWLIGPISAEAHEGSTAEVLGSGGFAVALLGLLLWSSADARKQTGRGIRGILWPIGAIGSMPLTVYTLQILVLAIFAGDYPVWILLVGMIAGSLIFASLWRRFLGAGPLERLIRLASQPGRT